MTLTFLHISDLHRTAGPRLSNDELFSAIASDSTRWEAEGIPRPDLIVVSGDLVQGAPIESTEADKKIAAQYREAEEFLTRIGEEFLDSDRSRIVIVPGNHDVHWGRAFRAMTLLEDDSDDIANRAWQALSPIRWSWKDCKAYEVCDSALYKSRLDHFNSFRNSFYGGITPSPVLHGGADLFFMEYQDIGAAVAGFSSWHGNDCFCHVGTICPSALELSRSLLAKSNARVAVGVWHHSIVGGPQENDYMDQRIVHRLIDIGFNLGFHGHQHFPDAAPFELRLPNLTSMVVVGAGSLAVGDRDLPMGERRQFNVVVVDPDNEAVTVHVRAMSPAGVFMGSHRDDFGGNTFITLKLPPAPLQRRPPTDLRKLDQAISAVAEKNFEDALELIESISPCHAEKKRQIEIESLSGLGRFADLIDALDPPLTIEEVIQLVSLLLEDGRTDDAMSQVEASKDILDKATGDRLKERIATKRMMG